MPTAFIDGHLHPSIKAVGIRFRLNPKMSIKLEKNFVIFNNSISNIQWGAESFDSITSN